MTPAIEARIVEMRRQHPGWGPRTILGRLARPELFPLLVMEGEAHVANTTAPELFTRLVLDFLIDGSPKG